MQPDIQKTVDRHELEIEGIKSIMSDLGAALKDNTASNQRLVNTLAVYTTKHDSLESKIKELQARSESLEKKSAEHGEKIASMSPTVESMRGLVWKIVTAVMLSSGGVATVAIAFLGSIK